MKIALVTGASGFVGREVCNELRRRGYQVKAAVRQPSLLFPEEEQLIIPEFDSQFDWLTVLRQVDVVIHLAARVHVMHDNSADPLAEFRRVNTKGAEYLARSAAAAGVRRFVYVSSIKVNGEQTLPTKSYSEQDVPAPQDPYGQSKWEAEKTLKAIANETGLEVVIVRPPLVYGAGVKGNFLQLLRAVAKGVPLPLASIKNQRDLIYVGNLADALIACATHPAAAGETYLVCDGFPLSTAQLMRMIAHAMRVTDRTFPCPPMLLKMAGCVIGKNEQVERLMGSLRLNDAKIHTQLKWNPPYSVEQGLRETAVWFQEKHIK